MSFNGSGTYVAPTGNPVVTGTVIQSSWANTLVTDISNTFNNTLPRDGQAPMSAALKIIDGTSTIPGIGFNSESATGIFRPIANNIALTVAGSELLRGNSAGRLMIGTTTDDGTTRLQVNGAISANGSLSLTGGLTFTGTGNRITGDFSNATVANRVMFQTSTVNGISSLHVIPNGTATQSTVTAANAADPTNASFATLTALATEASIRSGIAGTGTYMPMTFYTGGSERMRIDTAGLVGIGRAPVSGVGTLQVPSLQSIYSTGTTGQPRIQAIANDYLTGPSYRNVGLQLNDSAVAGNLIYMPTVAAANTALLEAINVSALAITTNGSPMMFGTSGIERMRIDNSGNVGVGGAPVASTTSKLFISGDITRIGGSAGYFGNLYYGSGWKYASTSTGISFGLVDGGTAVNLLVAPANAGAAGAAASPITALAIDGSGNVTATTQAATDNSTKVATTAYVKSNGMQAAGFAEYSTNTTLTTAQAGWCVDTTGTLTLTLPTAPPTGTTYFITNQGAVGNVLTITRGGTSVFYAAGAVGSTSLTLQQFDYASLCYDGTNWRNIGFGSQLGVGQTWQTAASLSHVMNTTYTNSTGKPIMLSFSKSTGTSTTASVLVGGVTMATINSDTTNGFSTGAYSVIVPNGITYQVNGTGGTWYELR